jgi:excinuclease ABC subunit C
MSERPAEDEFDPKALLKKLTQRPGVYRMLDAEGEIIYVGKAKNLRRRVSSYFSGRAHDTKTIAMLRLVRGIEVTVTRTETEALMLEYNLIKQHKPRFNVLLRDDKSFPYIHIGVDAKYPRISFYRGARSKSGRLFGPYPSAGSVRGTMNQLQKLFRIRGCEESYFANRTRPCLQYQIARCTAPCVGLVSEEEYRRDVDHAILFLEGRSDLVSERIAERMEVAAAELKFELAATYRDQLATLKNVQNRQLVSKGHGDMDVVAVDFSHEICCVAVLYFRRGRALGTRSYFPRQARDAGEDEVVRAFLLQFYTEREAPREVVVNRRIDDAATLADMLSERAGHKVEIRSRVRGDRRRWLEMARENAQQAAALRSRAGATARRQLEAFGEALGLGEPPRRIECFDISHTSGESTVASCVVFAAEGAVKSDYRRFNIRDVAPGDDYAAMAQVLERRYRKLRDDDARLPDVVMLDGGRGQLARAIGVLDELGIDNLALVAVAKGEGRKPGRESLFVPGSHGPIRLSSDDPALHLIQQIRDEAHRFAIMGHRASRGKQRTRSPLEDIRGLGPKRRRDLLRAFGGLQAISRAGVEDLMRVKGVSRQLAVSIYERFHSE